MIFDSINWEDEAKYIETVLGFNGEFREIGVVGSRVLIPVGSVDNKNPFFHITGELVFGIAYTREFKVFRMFHPSKGNKSMIHVSIPWADSVMDGPEIGVATCTREGNLILTRGLRKLGLLTPELVVRLNNSVTGHEKIEWELEFSEYL